MNDIQQKIERLRSELHRHNHNYYILNAPEISDREFDMMLKELERLEKEYPEYDDPLSPTHRVGSDLSKSFGQAVHERPMLSLSNTYTLDEVSDFFTRVSDAFSGNIPDIIGEMKYDGTSISLIYENGRLVRAVTRGDGTQGDVVTDNIKTIRSIPLLLQGSGWPDRFEIRGEILLPWADFERLNQERAFNEEPLFANPRNAAAGTLKLQNSSEVAKRRLDAYFYSLLSDELPADNHFDNLEAARAWGFKIAPVVEKLHTMADIERFIDYWDTARKELPVATDGLVFKVNSLRQQLNMGFTAKSPRWAIAYKFAAERALTKLEYVSFEVGRMGVITPVANLTPVQLSGTIVKRASLHNEDIIRSLDIHDGDWLYVEKGGEIIPKIVGVDMSQRQPSSLPVQFVKECPVCGTPLVRVEGEAAWICPNKYGCPPQIIGRMEHYVARRMMNIDGIGDETARLLYENGYARDAADLYHLNVGQLSKLPGFGKRSAERALQGVEESKKVPFTRVVYALSIPGVGESGAKKIARAVRSIDRLMEMTVEELTAIDDVGSIIAENIIEFFARPENRRMVERLREAGVQMAMPDDDDVATSNILAGESIVISGTFAHHSRDEYKAIIELHGGKNVSSISKKTTKILAGDNMGPSKLEKAKSLGIPIISEDEFLTIIEQANQQD